MRETARDRPPVIEVGTVQVSDGIWCIFEDREGNIWVGTNRGLVRLFRHTMTPVVEFGLVRSVETAAGGGIWVGTAGGVIRLAGQPATVAGRVAQLDGLDATSLDTDQTGALWVATGQTAWRVAGERLERGPVVAGPDPIRSIAGDGRGGVWLVDGHGQLLRWSEGRLGPFALSPRVSRVADRASSTWIAASVSGWCSKTAGSGWCNPTALPACSASRTDGPGARRRPSTRSLKIATARCGSARAMG